jgi:hypothetical protein
LPGQLVRPRYQPRPPRRPDLNTDWCAIGIQSTLGGNSETVHQGRDEGSTEIVTTDHLEVLASFYGPTARAMAARLRAGLRLGQNRTALRGAGISVSDIGEPRNVPEMVSGAWAARVDLPLNIHWETRARFDVRNLAGLSGQLVTDTGQTRNIK